MNTAEDCARQWAKHEKHGYYFMNLVKSIRSVLQIIIKKLNGSMRTCPEFIFKVPDLLSICLTTMTNVPPNKTPDNIVFGCKSYYVEH